MAEAAHKPGMLVRVDASRTIGVGHVMRCLALCQAWQDAGGTAHFAMAEANEAIERRILQENLSFHALQVAAGTPNDADASTELARQLQTDWILADGYRFGKDYLERLRAGAKRIAVLDDAGLVDCRSADLVINQNLHADQISYVSGDCVLRGTHYALLRREFRRMAPFKRDFRRQGAFKIVVALGGSDPGNFTAAIVSAIRESGFPCTLTVIAGPANENAERLALEFGDFATVLRNVGDVTPYFSAADIAVSSGGSAIWEFAFFQIPMIVCAQVGVEDRLASRLAAAGGCLYVGFLDSSTPGRIVEALQLLARDRADLQKLGERAGTFVDGLGASRVAAIMMEYGNMPLQPYGRIQ